MVILVGPVASEAQVNETRIKQVLDESWSTISKLTDCLVQNRGFSTRQAHGVVIRLVRLCRETGVSKSEVCREMLQDASLISLCYEIYMSSEDLHQALDPESSVRIQDMLFGNQNRIKDCRGKHLRAEELLEEAIEDILKSEH